MRVSEKSAEAIVAINSGENQTERRAEESTKQPNQESRRKTREVVWNWRERQLRPLPKKAQGKTRMESDSSQTQTARVMYARTRGV